MFLSDKVFGLVHNCELSFIDGNVKLISNLDLRVVMLYLYVRYLIKNFFPIIFLSDVVFG